MSSFNESPFNTVPKLLDELQRFRHDKAAVYGPLIAVLIVVLIWNKVRTNIA